MNQAVTTTSNVTFARVTITKTSESDDTWGTSATTDGQAFSVKLTSIPEIAASEDGAVTRTTTLTKITNDDVSVGSVIIGTSTSPLSVHIFSVADGYFSFHIANESTTSFSATQAIFNFVIL